MKPEVLKALNQLTSLVAGRDIALSTNDLADDPEARITHCIAAAAQEVTDGAMSGDQKKLKQGQRKLESLGSLKTLVEELT
jgi:hypothetical protein